MNNGIKERLLDIPSIIGIEPTYLTESSGKWPVLVKKAQKDNTRRAIDNVINETLFPDSQTERPGRSNIHNINFSLVTYTTVLQKNPHLPPSNSYNHHKMRTNTTFELHTTYEMKRYSLLSSTNKRNNQLNT